MSIKLMTLVWESGPTDPTDRLILLSLADQANDDGVCWPCVTTLASRVCLSERRVQARLSNLVQQGWIQRKVRYVDGRQTSSITSVCKEALGVTLPTPRGDAGVMGEGDATGTPGGDASDVQNRKKKPKIEPSYVGAFADFWSAYPKKVAKRNAEKAWNKIEPDSDLIANIINSLSTQSKTPQWLKDGGAYIPNAATWLNARRWEDELPRSEQPQQQPLYREYRPK